MIRNLANFSHNFNRETRMNHFFRDEQTRCTQFCMKHKEHYKKRLSLITDLVKMLTVLELFVGCYASRDATV